MFYSDAILSRRGPLGRVWLAAHMERKLSKTQTLQTDIGQSVEDILDQDIEFMALRLSGQLLLGVVRIYSRKAKYLLDDCNEALLKIKMAFRPGIVDLAEEQLMVNKNAIDLPGNAGVDIDVLLPDMEWDMGGYDDQPLPAHGQHQANIADITLRISDDLQPWDLDDIYGGDGGIGSQDFDGDLDLGLDWDDGDAANANMDSMSVDGSVGVGRDAGIVPEDVGDQFARMDVDNANDFLSNLSKSRDPSEAPMDVDMFDFGGAIDIGDLDFGDPGDKTPGQTRSPSRGSSPLTDVPVTPHADAEDTPVPVKPKRKTKEKKQIIDAIIELDGPAKGRGRNGLAPAMTSDVSSILTEPHFLPRSTVVMRLLEIRNDPLAHFLPTKTTKDGMFSSLAPPGLPPALTELFLRPVASGSKRRAVSPGKNANKRQRVDDDDIEQGRRAGSLAPSIGAGSDLLGDGAGGMDFQDVSGAYDDFQLDVPDDFDPAGVDMDGRAKSAAPSALSRLSTPAADDMPFVEDGDETYADTTCAIAMFDSRPMTQTQVADIDAGKEFEQSNADGKGYSKNTVKALGIIRRELKPVDGDDTEAKVLSFTKMADKASRRAAASFFFELLVLGTRDCVKISQSAPFENIEVRAKDKLWERQRHDSVAPSRAASVAPSTLGL